MSPADKVKEWKSILGARITIFALHQQKRLSYCPIKKKKLTKSDTQKIIQQQKQILRPQIRE
jgi:hypothetical protein